MALINCPECGKEISDKAKQCMQCGFPIDEYLQKNDKKSKEQEMYLCNSCFKQNEIGEDYCVFCGNRLTPYCKAEMMYEDDMMPCPFCKCANKIGANYCIKCGREISKTQKPFESLILREPTEKEENNNFEGIYRYTLLGKKMEVYCPRCSSPNCSHYKDQKIIPGKTKTQYTANLNPLKPFTLVNKREKVVRKERTYTENKFMCNSCGKIFY